MARIVTLLVKDKSGNWLDGVSLKPLSCVGSDADVVKLLARRAELIASEGLIKTGKSELKLSEVVCHSTATAGGEMKARHRFK